MLKTVINFCRQSVIRSRYCNGGPSDALYNSDDGGRYVGFGVVGLRLEELVKLKEELKEGERVRTFTLKPEHVPTRCNYPHTEIVAFEGGVEIEEPPKVIRKKMRERLHEAIQILLPTDLKGQNLQKD